MFTEMDHETVPGALLDPVSIPKEKILKALAEALASKPFRTSKQCQKFLNYVVVNSANGKEDSLKERVIGTEVLERPSDYNTSDDPVVRIRAADVRKRLAMYYQDEGKHAILRITMPPGSYRACFEAWDHAGQLSPVNQIETAYRDTLEELVAVDTAATQDAPLPQMLTHLQDDHRSSPESGRSSIWQSKLVWLSAIALILCIGVFVSLVRRDSYREYGMFWAPMVNGAHGPIIYVGDSAVYTLTEDFLMRYKSRHPEFKGDGAGREFTVPGSPNETISFGDLVPNSHDYVTTGDVAAAVAISSMFKEKAVHYDLRFGKDVVFGDFRSTPVVLIGAFNNSWTIELNDKLPYRFFYKDGVHGVYGEGHFWKTEYSGPGSPQVDYALITRQISPKSGEPVITAAGLDQTGTRGAAEFVSNPASLEAALHKLPSGWQNKKIQLLLRVSVLDYVPNGTDVIASSVE
jgi:hypothetical protein